MTASGGGSLKQASQSESIVVLQSANQIKTNQSQSFSTLFSLLCGATKVKHWRHTHQCEMTASLWTQAIIAKVSTLGSLQSHQPVPKKSFPGNNQFVVRKPFFVGKSINFFSHWQLQHGKAISPGSEFLAGQSSRICLLEQLCIW